MADQSQAATSLLTEHLQYTPLSLIDDIINSVNSLVFQILESLEQGLSNTPAEGLGFKPEKTPNDGEDGEVGYPAAKAEIEEGMHKLETLLYSTVDKNFDKFEIYVLRNILSVPTELVNWIRLGHYENLSYPLPDQAQTLESVQRLRDKLAASRHVSRKLQKEHNRNEAILQQLRSIVGTSQPATNNLSFLGNGVTGLPSDVSRNGGSQPLTTNTTFAVSQLPALKSLLADLRPRLAALQAAGTGLEGAKDEMREERRNYIEQRIQSHLGRHGVTLPEQQAALTGKQGDLEEVEALEKVASIFDPV